jgi:hypothetical protein
MAVICAFAAGDRRLSQGAGIGDMCARARSAARLAASHHARRVRVREGLETRAGVTCGFAWPSDLGAEKQQVRDMDQVSEGGLGLRSWCYITETVIYHQSKLTRQGPPGRHSAGE